MSRNEKARILPVRRRLQLAVLAAVMVPGMAFSNEEVEALINPDATQFSVGYGRVDDENHRFGMYNGLDEGKGYAIGEFNLVRRYEDTGTWVRLTGRNLGLDTAEASAEYERQGDWRIGIDYTQIPRVSPYDIRTNLRGIGSANLSYPNNTNALQPASTSHETKLETNRYKTRLQLSRYFGPEFEVKVQFQNEHKHGERLFGRGTAAGGGLYPQEFLAEPIDYQIRQVDASVNYTGERLQLSAGYYGSFFNNDNPALNITGGAATFNTAGNTFSPIALPPDNSAHQFSLTGGYQFTDTTRGMFKLAHTRAIQDDDFISVMNCNPGGISNCNTTGRNDLGGRVDTTLVDLGLTARPLPQLSLLGKLRYEDRDDETTVVRYITPTGTTSSTDGFNEPRSLKTESGKVEATYQLPQGFSLTGGLEGERKERNVEGVRIVGYRAEVEEVTYKAILRRALSETLNGSLGFAHSDRTGTDFRTLRTWNTTLNGGAGGFNMTDAGLYVLGGLLQPIYMADRDRNKITLALDWMPTDRLSLQFNGEKSRDDYDAGRNSQLPTDLSPDRNPNLGVRDGDAWLLNVDASFQINDDWNVSAWASRNVTNLDQATCRNKTTAALCIANSWDAGLTTRSDALGLGLRGKVLGKLNLGGDLTHLRDKNEYDQAGVGTAATAADLPTITSHTTTLKLFADYEFGKQSSVRLDYVFDRRKTDDWTWDGWQYSDGTVVELDPVESVHFIGVSYRYGFR